MVDRYNPRHRSQYDEDCSYTTRVYGCVWTSLATGCDATSGGRFQPSPDKVHSMVARSEETDPNNPGWSLPDARLAASRLGFGFTNRTGDGWDTLIELSDQGHYILCQGDSDQFGSETCSGAFDGDHCIGIHPDHKVVNGVRFRKIHDPICGSSRYARESVLHRYASDLDINIRFGVFNGLVPVVGSTGLKPGDAMASAIRSESRRIASDSVVRVRAGAALWASEKKDRKVRVLSESTLLMDMGVPYGAGGFRAVRLLSGQFDTDDDREGGIALVDKDDVTGGPRKATDDELAAIRRLFS